ncbi:MAG: type II 3-dehydroquinate dehydratase [Gemmatimonadales bacterium]|nr:MAG: type II 3-dehydroquinate dehydratase [Gemmatimonadales bacterium]
MRIGIVHGPNLRLLGRREPEVYGSTSLSEVDLALGSLAGELGVELEVFQSNHEGEILDWLEARAGGLDGVVINPAALTHGSIGLRDALLGLSLPFVEVHISNPHAREPFRKESVLADVASGVVFGFGPESYLLGLRGLHARLSS